MFLALQEPLDERSIVQDLLITGQEPTEGVRRLFAILEGFPGWGEYRLEMGEGYTRSSPSP